MNGPMRVTAEEIGVGRFVCFHGIITPNGTASRNGSEMIQHRGVDEPEIGVADVRCCERAFSFALVQELTLGRVITSQNDAILPAAKVADDFQVSAPRTDAS